MGKLNTALGLPKKILLQGWGNDQLNIDINGEYIYGEFTLVGPRSGYIRQGAYLAYIYFDGYRWNHYSDDIGWVNNSTNPDVLPSNGWSIYNALGPAGTITPILTNIKNISIKKQNLTSLKSAIYHIDAIYVFKSATNNTLAQIFNISQFEDGDTLNVTSNGNTLSFFADKTNNMWIDFSLNPNKNNYVIPANSLLVFSSSYDINISVGGGAIIQKYYSGKINVK